MASLTAADVPNLRTNSAPLPTTVGPAVSADAYKSPLAHSKPRSKVFNRRFSVESRNFNGSAMKKSASVSNGRKIIPLGTGRPTADYYPWELLAFEGIQNDSNGRKFQNGTQLPTMQTVSKTDSGYNLSLALNYGNAVGSPHLLRFITEHTEIVHNPPYANWGICLTAGATSAMETAYRIFCDRGDNILMEEYSYPGTIEGARQLDLRINSVPMDAEGACPNGLRHILDTWDSTRGAKPTVFYTIPSGHNPTGATQSLERRKEIYRIAEEHDLIIIEDDPYYHLRAGNCTKVPEECGPVPTYLSIDKSGRVVRLDSTSKILAPGLRMGWVTASDQIIDKFLAYQEVGTVAVAGPSQLMLWKLLDQSWGHQGFATWLQNLSLEYRYRLKIFIDACEKYLPGDICSWVEPEYGMFLWISLDWQKHPRFQTRNKDLDSQLEISAIESRILSAALMNGVQVTQGSLFKCNKDLIDSLNFRMTFAAAAKEDLEEGLRIFADTVKSEFSLTE